LGLRARDSLGCPLSPLIGAFFLDQLDHQMTATGLFYVRFMDDILVLAPTRWKLRRAIGLVNRILGALRLEKHPGKTFIGRIERGFDFLGYHFTAGRLTLAVSTVANFLDRASRLYEQEREKPNRSSRLGVYVRRWVGWAKGGLSTSRADNGNAGRAARRGPPCSEIAGATAIIALVLSPGA
jgi:RNA-directed DNA polymerase